MRVYWSIHLIEVEIKHLKKKYYFNNFTDSLIRHRVRRCFDNFLTVFMHAFKGFSKSPPVEPAPVVKILDSIRSGNCKSRGVLFARFNCRKLES